ncbi:hypothetical protein TNCT_699701 [Trichonephila clavata]|uniref:Pre-C2HC domain-containing protein n=1 Tax=Trichonephila clavata TaxID=2740835 RepID=A0A8X6GN60_TRICU|nr:hypothetical protein TNCT_699701 [Trichonephila clavata]
MAETYIQPPKFIPNTEEYPALPGTSQEVNTQKPKPKNKAPELQRTYPTSTNKLTGEYIKISTENMDDHRKITAYLKSIKEQFFVLNPPPSSRAQKIVIEGLPVSTDIADIKTDLESQGYSIEKVAQLTKTKTKFPLPIFMVETKKLPDSPDILKELTKCCYMKREPLGGSKSAISETEAPKTHTEKPAPSVPRNNNNNNDENFTFMDVMKEIKNLFKEFPYLIELAAWGSESYPGMRTEFVCALSSCATS